MFIEKNLEIDSLSILKRAFSPVSAELAQLLIQIPGFILCDSAVGKKMTQHLFSNPGKMIRPALYLMCCKLVGYDGPHKFAMAAVSEFVHTASLLHDDVIDNSTLRRNKPTANSIWGDEAAVLFGDLIYSRASEMMAETESLEIVASFARAIRVMSESELLQLEHVYDFNIDESTYIKILLGKTATLIGTACKCAGLLAGSTEGQLECLEDFGLKIGTAFQLIDDALDFLGEGQSLGKKSRIDLQEGKVTLPVILLRDFLQEDEKQTLKSLAVQGTFSVNEIEQIAFFVNKYGTAELTLQRAQDMTVAALEKLHSVFPPSPQRADLENLASFLSFRTY